MPDITYKKIWDKSKADEAVKLFAFCQAWWAVLTTLGRAAQGLPITLLELETGAIIACSLFTFCFWYNKPMDLTQPTKLHANISIANILIRAGDEAKKPYSRTPLDFVEYLILSVAFLDPKSTRFPVQPKIETFWPTSGGYTGFLICPSFLSLPFNCSVGTSASQHERSTRFGDIAALPTALY